MEIDYCNSYEELSQKASETILGELNKKKGLLLCTATGNSPAGAYRLLGEEFNSHPERFDSLRILKLDEWGGIPNDHPGTCESFIQAHLLRPLEISESRYIGFNSNPENPKDECLKIQDQLVKNGPIDLCILGLGMNGHLAFNEPADYLEAHSHIAKLSSVSMQHAMAAEMHIKPSYGLTLGMADILQSKMILMLIDGKQKKKIVNGFLSKEITTLLPASFLWLHSNVKCLINRDTIE